jgi:hypothetical protein
MNFIISIIPLINIIYGYPSSNTGGNGISVSTPVLPSRNVMKIPIDLPVHICGDELKFLAIVWPELAKTCINNY